MDASLRDLRNETLRRDNSGTAAPQSAQPVPQQP
jgi:hypothetical protein